MTDALREARLFANAETKQRHRRKIEPDDAAAARHGQDRLSLFARWRMGRQAAAAAEEVYDATVDMLSSLDPGLRYSQLFWAFPNKHGYSPWVLPDCRDAGR
jgi:hypothetical protein